MAVALNLLPSAPCKVRNGDRSGIVLYRDSRKLTEAAPFRKVVDIHVQRKAVVQAIYQTVVHYEVHSAVASYLFGHFFKFLDDRMFVFFHESGLHLGRNSPVHIEVFMVRNLVRHDLLRTETVFLYRVFACVTVRTGELVHPAVRARRHHIVLDMNRFTVGSTDKGMGMVSVLEVFRTFPGSTLHVCRTVHRLGIHRNEGHHPVAPVDVEQLAGRAHAMCRVNVAAELFIEGHPPVVPIIRPELFEVVDISTLYSEDFPEQTVLRHIQSRHLEEVVNTVFKLHAMFACSFGSIDKCPYFIEIHCGRNFYGDMLSVLHRIYGHFGMMLPVRTDVYQVYVLAVAKLFPGIFGSGIGRDIRKTSITHNLLCPFHHFRPDIAQGGYPGARHVNIPLYCTYSPHSETDETDSHSIDRLGGETYDIFLAGRPFRDDSINGPVDFSAAGRNQKGCNGGNKKHGFFHDSIH